MWLVCLPSELSHCPAVLRSWRTEFAALWWSSLIGTVRQNLAVVGNTSLGILKLLLKLQKERWMSVAGIVQSSRESAVVCCHSNCLYQGCLLWVSSLIFFLEEHRFKYWKKKWWHYMCLQIWSVIGNHFLIQSYTWNTSNIEAPSSPQRRH